MDGIKDNYREGRLPSSAPLANPYVPFQRDDPPKYEATTALVKGTLFPGLDLPFLGMSNKKERNITPMLQMQALAFAVQELALYLNTHRDDKEALELYRSYQKMYHECAKKYTKDGRQINHRIPSSGKYSWLDDPWPWEYCWNEEV